MTYQSDVDRDSAVAVEWVDRSPSPADSRQTHHSLPKACELTKIVRSALRLFAYLAGLWIPMYAAYRCLPYIRPGHELVYEKKQQWIYSGLPFPERAPHRVVIFGNSKVLCGFVPDQFDALNEGRTHSINLGLPDATHFVPELERIVRSGTVPDLVLLTVSWNPGDSYAALRWPTDSQVMQYCFPFRRMPRDLVIFLMRSQSRGGPAAYYREGQELLVQMERDRGYFFIEGQSHFADHRLPDDFRLAADRPRQLFDRRLSVQAADFDTLQKMADAHGIEFVFVPTYFRQGEYAPPPAVNRQAADQLNGHPRFRLAGPDYMLFPNNCFSDPLHVNPEGARRYTAALADLCRELILNLPPRAASRDGVVLR